MVFAIPFRDAHDDMCNNSFTNPDPTPGFVATVGTFEPSLEPSRHEILQERKINSETVLVTRRRRVDVFAERLFKSATVVIFPVTYGMYVITGNTKGLFSATSEYTSVKVTCLLCV